METSSPEPDPGEADARLGHVTLDPAGDVVAGSLGAWRVVYTVGECGISSGGGIVLARPWPADWGQPQWTAPTQRDYVTFSTTGAGRLVPRFELKKAGLAWNPDAIHALFVEVRDCTLGPGDRITVILGDASAGSPGMLAQTFLEEASRLTVAVDVYGDGQWQRLPPLPALTVVGGPASRLVVVAPSTVGVGEVFEVHLRVEDAWGNPAHVYRGRILLETEGHESLSCQFGGEDAGVARLSYRLTGSGVHRLMARDEAVTLSATSNPIVCTPSSSTFKLLWGDLHGQSQMGCGARTVEDFLRHARDVAGVDFAAEQANDHYLSDAKWAETQRVVRELHDPGRFVTFLGYEWSGETSDGGDHNVYYLDDEGPIRRSSHSLIPDPDGLESDLGHITEVYDAFRGQRVCMAPHVGGRTADLAYHDRSLEPVIEIHSSHATSEWFLREALQRGYQVGVVAGSDDVMGRPGASSPGNHVGRNVRGGLTAVYARKLTRESIWEAIMARRCYATTGARIFLSVAADGRMMGEAYQADAPPSIEVEVIGTGELEAVELFRGEQIICSPIAIDYSQVQPDAIRIVWMGAREKGSAHLARLVWDGELTLDSGRIIDVEPVAFDTPASGIQAIEDRRIAWGSFTAGDRDGLLIRYDAPASAEFRFSTAPASFRFTPADLATGPVEIDAGPVGRRVVVSRVSKEPGPDRLRFTYRDDQIAPGVNPYYVRVTQSDGEQAWSSPIYVTRV